MKFCHPTTRQPRRASTPDTVRRMRRAEYLANPDVIAFAAWMKKRLCEPGSFTHSWTSGYGRAWSCSSLYGAYLGYRWPDNSTQSLDEVSRELDEFSSRIRRAVEQGDQVAFNDAALAALDWIRGPLVTTACGGCLR